MGGSEVFKSGEVKRCPTGRGREKSLLLKSVGGESFDGEAAI